MSEQEPGATPQPDGPQPRVAATPAAQPTPRVLVSVIIPAYNAAGFISETVDSVLSQSFTGYEVVVVNDGSPDTPALEQALRPYLDRIVYLTQENRGPSGARNAGILAARGAYVAFLDSDDLLMPEYLAAQMKILASDPELDLLYSNGVVIGDVPYAGRDIMSLAPSRGAVTFERLISLECSVPTSCVVARRQFVIDAGLFDERFRRSEDFHLWARMAYRGARIGYQRQVLVKHRRWQGSLSDDRTAMAEAAVAVLRDLEATLPLTRHQKTLVHRHIAGCHAYVAFEEGKRLFLTGESEGAVKAFGRALTWEHRPWQRARIHMLRIALRLAPGALRRAYDLLRRPAGPLPARTHS